MRKCFKCGISDSDAILFDAICNEGVKKICKNCLENEKLPVIKKPTEMQIEKSKEKNSSSVYERLSKINKPKENSKIDTNISYERSLRSLCRQEENSLLEFPKELVEHFHWIIMRKRRNKKITHKSLAEKIKVPEQVLISIEKGKVPENYLEIISKIEKELDTILIKEEFRNKKLAYMPEDKASYDDLTISDLREMKRKKEEKLIKEEWPKEKEDLSEEEINRILFGN